MARTIDSARRVISGTWGELWIDGEKVAEVSACQAKVALNKETVNLCVEIERIEEKSVAVIYKAIKSLFATEGDEAAALRAMRMRQFYALQEKVLRASKKSAQTVEEILLQNS